MHYYVESWQKYADFQGRSSRPAYWWPALVSFLISLILSLLIGPLYLIHSLAYLCPSIALGVRRLHDVGRSGKWMWLLLTGIGAIALLYWAVQPSSQETNEWGPPTGPNA
ncbi:MAG: DUF805 domain-containing protein [Actinomycetota bacterium]|nr:DUF805 domain-containing protein [Actinomycetota bacterium]MEC9473215.1 DUF805 domain-containing protein [Actinomycetota bacterium]